MRTEKRHEGYLLIDNRFGPGTTEEYIRANAPPGTAFAGEGKQFEAATLTCSHCNRVFLKNPDRERPRNRCAKCNHYVCDNPGCHPSKGCITMNQVIEEMRESITLSEQRGDPNLPTHVEHEGRIILPT